jgi:hypothetical protein
MEELEKPYLMIRYNSKTNQWISLRLSKKIKLMTYYKFISINKLFYRSAMEVNDISQLFYCRDKDQIKKFQIQSENIKKIYVNSNCNFNVKGNITNVMISYMYKLAKLFKDLLIRLGEIRIPQLALFDFDNIWNLPEVQSLKFRINLYVKLRLKKLEPSDIKGKNIYQILNLVRNRLLIKDQEIVLVAVDKTDSYTRNCSINSDMIDDMNMYQEYMCIQEGLGINLTKEELERRTEEAQIRKDTIYPRLLYESEEEFQARSKSCKGELYKTSYETVKENMYYMRSPIPGGSRVHYIGDLENYFSRSNDPDLARMESRLEREKYERERGQKLGIFTLMDTDPKEASTPIQEWLFFKCYSYSNVVDMDFKEMIRLSKKTELAGINIGEFVKETNYDKIIKLLPRVRIRDPQLEEPVKPFFINIEFKYIESKFREKSFSENHLQIKKFYEDMEYYFEQFHRLSFHPYSIYRESDLKINCIVALRCCAFIKTEFKDLRPHMVKRLFETWSLEKDPKNLCNKYKYQENVEPDYMFKQVLKSRESERQIEEQKQLKIQKDIEEERQAIRKSEEMEIKTHGQDCLIFFKKLGYKGSPIKLKELIKDPESVLKLLGKDVWKEKILFKNEDLKDYAEALLCLVKFKKFHLVGQITLEVILQIISENNLIIR